MSAEVVNLRRFRKQKARAVREQQAAANRAAFGRPKHERERTKAERQLQERHLDALQREDTLKEQ